jgi:ketosteroid isomerase-like protein
LHARPTHTGDWDLLGVKVPATGKSVELNMVFIWRIADGRIAEGWELDDNMPVLQALGVVDYTEFGKPLEEVFR